MQSFFYQANVLDFRRIYQTTNFALPLSSSFGVSLLHAATYSDIDYRHSFVSNFTRSHSCATSRIHSCDTNRTHTRDGKLVLDEKLVCKNPSEYI